MPRSRLVNSLSIQKQIVSYRRMLFPAVVKVYLHHVQNKIEWMGFWLRSKISHFFWTCKRDSYLAEIRRCYCLGSLDITIWLVKYTYKLVVLTSIQYSDSNGVKFGCTSTARKSVDPLHVVCNCLWKQPKLFFTTLCFGSTLRILTVLLQDCRFTIPSFTFSLVLLVYSFIALYSLRNQIW